VRLRATYALDFQGEQQFVFPLMLKGYQKVSLSSLECQSWNDWKWAKLEELWCRTV
jgi:hypothetical protein